MSEGRDIRSNKYRLGFMFRSIQVSKIALDYWLSVPEFEERMIAMMDRHEPIVNETVLRVMEEVYERDFKPVQNTPDGIGKNFYLARKAINQLRRAVSEANSPR